MATALENSRPESSGSEIYSFTLVLAPLDDVTEEMANALHDAGCDDALFGMSNGKPVLHFDREAPSYKQAIFSAIEAVEGCGLGFRVERVLPPGAEDIEMFNEYLSFRKMKPDLEPELRANLWPKLLS